jgi:predicted class III extradiol MEMO1 family dioxygenase
MNSVDKIEDVSDALFVNSSEFEWYSKRFSDLTDDQKSDMEELLQADLDTTLEQIQLSKDRIDMLKSETNIYTASINDRINAMAGLSMMEELKNEKMIFGMQKRAKELAAGTGLDAILEEEFGTLNSKTNKIKR